MKFRFRIERLCVLMQAADFFAWAQMALAHYELVKPDLNFIRHNENITFQVIDNKSREKYLLRIHKPVTENFVSVRRQPFALASELLWLEALYRDSTLTVQQPVRNINGEFVTSIRLGVDPIPCTLLRWIEGEIFEQSASNAPALMEALGGVISQLHKHVSGWYMPSDFVRPVYDSEFFRRQATLFWPGVVAGIVTMRDYALIQEMVAVIADLLAPVERSQEYWGLIHADLHRGNCLVYQQEIRPIDFSLCGFGYLLFDFGSSLPSFKGTLRQACIDGYLKQRPLPEGYLQLVEAFCLLSRMCSYVFMLPKVSEKERLKQRIAHFVAHECQQFLRNEPILLTM